MYKEAAVTYFNLLPLYMSGMSKKYLRISGYQANYRTADHRMQRGSTNQSIERRNLQATAPSN
jgi:hypothetical protein